MRRVNTLCHHQVQCFSTTLTPYPLGVLPLRWAALGGELLAVLCRVRLPVVSAFPSTLVPVLGRNATATGLPGSGMPVIGGIL